MAEDDVANPSPDDSAASVQEPAEVAPPRPVIVHRRRGFFRRWLSRLVALLLMVIVVALILLVSLTILLRSDLPRSLAESAATQALGLELTLGDLEIGWGGDVTITDFGARLPDFGQAVGEKLLEIKRIEVELDSLPIVALNYLRGRQPALRRVEVDSPTLYVTQSPDGQWSLVRAFTLVTSVRRRAGAGGNQFELPPLPDLQLTNGSMRIRKADGTESLLTGFDLAGGRENPLVYRLAGGTASKLTVSGELFPGSGRRQQLRLELAGLDENLRKMFGVPEATLYASWTGGLTNEGFEGMLQIQSATLEEIRLSGGLRIGASAGRLRIWPVDLHAEGLPRIGAATIPQGEIRIDSEISVEGLIISALGGQALVRSAFFNPGTFRGKLDVVFRDISPGPDDSVSGELALDAGHDLFGEPFATARLDASGRLGEASFENLSAELIADGHLIQDWGTLDLALRLREHTTMSLGGRASTTLPPLEVPIRVRVSDVANPRIEFTDLMSLDPEAVELAGNGVLFVAEGADHAAGEWWLSLWQRGLPVTLPRIEDQMPTQLSLEAEGRVTRGDPNEPLYIRITQFFGAVGPATVSGTGEYVVNGSENTPPLVLELTLRRDVNLAAPHFEQIQGSLLGMFTITGDPRALEFTGTGGVEADGLVIGEMEIGRVRSDVSVTLTKSLLSITTLHDAGRFRQRTEVLGAFVDLEAQIPLSPAEVGHVSLAIEQLDLREVSRAMDLPLEVAGLAGGEIHVDLAGLSLGQAQARGWFEVAELAVPGLEVADRVLIGIAPEQADDGDARGGVFFREGELALPVSVVQHMEVAPGPTIIAETRRMSFDLAYNLNRPSLIEVRNIHSEGYPLEYPAREEQGRYLHLELAIQPSELRIDLSSPPQARGEFVAGAEISTGIAPFELTHLGSAQMTLTALNNRVDVTRLMVDLGEVGDIAGDGMLDLGDLAGRSQLMLQGSGLNLAALARELRIPEGAAGTADIALLLQPGGGSVPRGEVMIDFSFAGHEANWRDVQIGQGQIIAYASRQRSGGEVSGPFDFNLLTTDRLHLELAGGRMEGYARLRNRRGAGGENEWHVNGTLQATALDLAQLGSLFDQDLEGRVDLWAAAYGNLAPRPRFGESSEDLPWLPVNGEATLAIRRGELRRFNLFNRILEVTNLAGNTAQQDWLDGRFRLEQGDAYVENLVAFVDGIEIRMSASIDDVLDPWQATLSASGVVLPRPLSQIRLPFFAEADDILSAVQSTAGTDTYRASGPLLDPTVIPAAWEEMGDTLRVLLVPAARGQ